MTLNNKILPVALVAALLGASAGAFVMRPAANKTAETSAATQTSRNLVPTYTAENATANNDANGALNNTAEQNELSSNPNEIDAYRQGFVDGVRTLNGSTAAQTRTVTQVRQSPAATRVVYRDRTRYARQSNSRQVYYDYEQPRKRSFWSKHRDKLTVAMGTGGGAVVGGLLGGKKGAAIGALAGAGGSALYTYKLRKRNNRY